MYFGVAGGHILLPCQQSLSEAKFIDRSRNPHINRTDVRVVSVFSSWPLEDFCMTWNLWKHIHTAYLSKLNL